MGQSRRRHQKEVHPVLKVIPDRLDLLEIVGTKVLQVPQ
jgi:hypothetical protein